MENRKNFAIIDTETNWNDKVMSIGAAVADCETYELVDSKYYILTPECSVGGMYSSALPLKNNQAVIECSRADAMLDLIDLFYKNNVKSVFAYNALFDYRHLSELSDFLWFDIMKVAAYKQYNFKIPESAECCKTGRLKRNYGVQSIIRMLTDDYGYYETHNALYDALDELQIMKFLNLSYDTYKCAVINKA